MESSKFSGRRPRVPQRLGTGGQKKSDQSRLLRPDFDYSQPSARGRANSANFSQHHLSEAPKPITQSANSHRSQFRRHSSLGADPAVGAGRTLSNKPSPGGSNPSRGNRITSTGPAWRSPLSSAGASARKNSEHLPVSNALKDRLRQQRALLKRKRRYYLGAFVLVLAVIAGLVWIGFFSSILTFNKNRVGVEGANGAITAQEIRAELAPLHGKQLLRLSLSDLEQKLQNKKPWIKDISIHRDFPDGLIVQITPRVPVAKTREGALVDKEGIVLKPGKVNIAGLPLIDASCGKTQSRCYRQATACLGGLSDGLKQRMENIQITRPNAVIVILKGGRQIIWGDEKNSNKKAQVAEILLQRPGRTVNVTDYVHPTLEQ